MKLGRSPARGHAGFLGFASMSMSKVRFLAIFKVAVGDSVTDLGGKLGFDSRGRIGDNKRAYC